MSWEFFWLGFLFHLYIYFLHLYCSTQHFNLQIPELHFSEKGQINCGSQQRWENEIAQPKNWQHFERLISKSYSYPCLGRYLKVLASAIQDVHVCSLRLLEDQLQNEQAGTHPLKTLNQIRKKTRSFVSGTLRTNLQALYS